MCGIAGTLSFVGQRLPAEEAEKMSRLLKHRGPDDDGVFVDSDVSLIHRRLSILDLSDLGHQPMHSDCGNFTIVWNGECYNYLELRAELEAKGIVFKSETDTEVVLEGLVAEGMSFLQKMNGMFGFAFYSKVDKKMYLVRDRLGIKPLYYFRDDERLVFSSEIKPILTQQKSVKVNQAAISSYLVLRYVPGEETLFQGVKKVLPGHIIEVDCSGKFLSRCYWSLNDQHDNSRYVQSEDEVFYDLLHDSVKLRMRSDVEVGSLLSGGIDSSAIVGLVSKQREKVNTYTMELGVGSSEVSQAESFASSLRMPHETVSFDANNYDQMNKVIWHLEEPLGDSIILPTYQLMGRVSQKNKVILSGEGADEILGGYAHQWALPKLMTFKAVLPFDASYLSRGLEAIPANVLDAINPYPIKLGEVLSDRLAKVLNSPASHLEFLNLVSLFGKNELGRLGFQTPSLAVREFENYWQGLSNTSGAFKNLLRQDLWFWCSNYTTMRVDKLSMAHGVEVRLPYLDHRVVEFSLARKLKVWGELSQKKLLREAMAKKKILPKQIVKRKKVPFFYPVEKEKGKKYSSFAREVLSSAEGLKNLGFCPEELSRFVGKKEWSTLEGKQVVGLVNLELWSKIFLGGNWRKI